MTSNSASSSALKRLYRAVAKRIHPDLASDPADRQKRGKLMAEANAAYQRHDLDTLTNLFEQHESSLEGLHTWLEAATADEAYTRGAVLWKQRQYKLAVECFAHGLRLNPNHAALQFYFGLACYQGLGVAQTDHALATNWWRKAAEQGNVEAQNNLAQAYELGYGVEQDLRQAADWFQRAAERNHATSQFNLGVLYELGKGVPQNAAQAAYWYRRAAEQGYGPAQLNLAAMYELGHGVPQDFTQAATWYREAAESGEESAREALWHLLRRR
jgi:TPR repeat protein